MVHNLRSTLTNNKIVTHSCLRALKRLHTREVNYTALTPEEYEAMPFKCPHCTVFASDNKRALNTHSRVHNRAVAAPTPVNNVQVARAPHNSDEDIDPSPASTQDSGHLPANENIDIQDLHAAEALDNSTTNHEQEDLPTTEEAQDALLSSIQPHPGDDIPSDIHIDAFKEILADYNDSKWDAFEENVKLFIKGARENAKISDVPPSSAARRELNPNDPTDTQRLYRRNRR